MINQHWRSAATSLTGNVLGTSKGVWVLDVLRARRTDDCVTLDVMLKHRDQSRRALSVQITPPAIEQPRYRELLACAIRAWVESTEGNGRLDLSSLARHPEWEDQAQAN